jgi:hypothetical protein
MTDLDRIRLIENTLGIKLIQVPFDEMRIEKCHNTDADKRSYSVDEDNNVTGLFLAERSVDNLPHSYFQNSQGLKSFGFMKQI